MPITPGASGDREVATVRLTPRPPGTPPGVEARGLDEARGIEPGEGSLLDRDVPLGDVFAGVRGQQPGERFDATRSAAADAHAARADDTLRPRRDGLD